MANEEENVNNSIPKNKYRYGDDYFSKIGKLGGAKGRGKDYKGGFAYVAPGQEETNGKRFGAMGGYLSKRARFIDINDPLRSDEMNELLKLGIRVLGTMRMNGIIDIDVEQKNHVTLYEKAGEGDWKYIFTDCGVGASIKVVWMTVLSAEMDDYRSLSKKRFEENTKPILTKDESNRYRIIRNLVRAFELASGIEVY